ncbi:UNVERIFIED_CONTAM: hypothetical protein K2H54_063216, partial [Gekko kuhli]
GGRDTKGEHIVVTPEGGRYTDGREQGRKTEEKQEKGTESLAARSDGVRTPELYLCLTRH